MATAMTLEVHTGAIVPAHFFYNFGSFDLSIYTNIFPINFQKKSLLKSYKQWTTPTSYEVKQNIITLHLYKKYIYL